MKHQVGYFEDFPNLFEDHIHAAIERGDDLGAYVIEVINHKYGNEELLKALLAAEADVNTRDPEYRSALHLAVKNNRADMVRVLVQNGADLTYLDQDRNSLMMIATYGITGATEPIPNMEVIEAVTEALQQEGLSTKIVGRFRVSIRIQKNT